jgi:hypothetical protein
MPNLRDDRLSPVGHLTPVHPNWYCFSVSKLKLILFSVTPEKNVVDT